jgi:hypothetical protein
VRKINKNLYPTKWGELLQKYGEEQATELYWKFSRSFCLEKYILKYGKDEGEKIFEDKKSKINRWKGLETCIEKHGLKDGTEIYNKWKASIINNEEGYIRRFGEEEGRRRFKEFSDKCYVLLKPYQKTMPRQTRLDYWIKKCNGDVEEAKKMLHKRQTVATLDRYIERHGKENGLKKYQENNLKKSLTIDRFVERYGDTGGPQKFYEWKENLRYAKSLKSYIEKYGEKDGTKKYLDFINKKRDILEKARNVPRKERYYSLVSSRFFTEIISKIKDNFKSIYYGEDEWFFGIHDGENSIFYIDFYIKDINFGVEFYGDYWHRNPDKYRDELSIKIQEYDKKRIIKIINKFKTHIEIVWENEYKDKPIETVDKIVGIILREKEKHERNKFI